MNMLQVAIPRPSPVDPCGVTRQAMAYRSAVAQHLEPGQPISLAGYPEHDNSGDAAIYLGEIALFDDLNTPIGYVCSRHNFKKDLALFASEGPIFLHGGGNFGDLYSDHLMRLRILRAYPDRKIVQLPQTIHFQRQEATEEMARLIDRQRDFHLMVRDLPSFEFARRHFDCEVTLVPDAAYYLKSLDPSGRPRHDVVSVQRLDAERCSDAMSDGLRRLGPVRDWQFGNVPASYVVMKIRRRLRFSLTAQARREADDMAFRRKAYRSRAWARLGIAVGVLSSARVSVSDRLHAHIIASLLGKRHVALDNSYGKISGYLDTWGNDDLALLATTVDEVRSAVSLHLAGEPVPTKLGYASGQSQPAF